MQPNVPGDNALQSLYFLARSMPSYSDCENGSQSQEESYCTEYYGYYIHLVWPTAAGKEKRKCDSTGWHGLFQNIVISAHGNVTKIWKRLCYIREVSIESTLTKKISDLVIPKLVLIRLSVENSLDIWTIGYYDKWTYAYQQGSEWLSSYTPFTTKRFRENSPWLDTENL